MRLRKLTLFMAMLLIAVCGGYAQRRTVPPPRANVNVLERIESMSPEERHRVLDRLPSARRARVEQRLQELQQLSPEERRRLRRQFWRFRQLPPERQQAARRLFFEWRQLPEPRRRALGREAARLRLLTNEDRAVAVNSADYRSRFSAGERKMIETLLDISGPRIDRGERDDSAGSERP